MVPLARRDAAVAREAAVVPPRRDVAACNAGSCSATKQPTTVQRSLLQELVKPAVVQENGWPARSIMRSFQVGSPVEYALTVPCAP